VVPAASALAASLRVVVLGDQGGSPEAIAKRVGGFVERDAAKVEALEHWRTSDLYSPAERAALDYTEAMTITGQGVTDAGMTELRRHFTDDAVIELTGLVAFQNLSSKFNSALDVPPQGFCRRPEE